MDNQSMSIKAVVFDYGHVISLPQNERVLDNLAELAGVKRDKFEAVFWSMRGEYDRGSITAREYYSNVFSSFNSVLNEDAIEKMMALELQIWDRLDPGTVKLMEDVKKAGLLLGILSNMPRDFLAWARKNVPVVSLADVSVFSCEHNTVKPEEAIYLKLISLLGTESSEVVFFDDVEKNINAARALGIEALLWKDSETARKDLSALGLSALKG